MKKVIYTLFLLLLFGQFNSSLAVSCLDLANMLRDEVSQPDKLVQTYRAYGVAKCKDIDGDWMCFQCNEGGGPPKSCRSCAMQRQA